MKQERLAPEDHRWLAFLARRDDATAVHHPAWSAVLHEAYGFPVSVVAFVGSDGEFAGGVPVADVAIPLRGRRWVSLPFTDHCPPLLPEGSDRRDVLAALDELRRAEGISSLELRDDVAVDRDLTTNAGVRHTLTLDPESDRYFTSLKSSVRRNIRAGMKNGVRIERCGKRRDVTETFYRLQSITRRRLGVPVQPRRYFDALWRNIVATDLGFLLLAFVRDRPIAGAIFFEWKSKIIYKHGASDHSFWSVRPNDLLFWRAIEASAEKGVKAFDFGRSAYEDAGLRRFKSGWGANEAELVYTRIAAASATASVPRASRLIAPLIRRAPVAFARLLGTAFYRYAA